MRSLRNLSLKTRIVAAVCFVNLAVIILVSYGNYHWYSAQLTDQTMEQTQQIIEQAGSNINTYINELYRLTLTPYYNDELLHTLEQTATSPQQQLEFKRVVEGFLASVMSLPRSEILRVYIMNDTALYSYTRTPYEMAEYNNYLESDWYNQAWRHHRPDPAAAPFGAGLWRRLDPHLFGGRSCAARRTTTSLWAL